MTFRYIFAWTALFTCLCSSVAAQPAAQAAPKSAQARRSKKPPEPPPLSATLTGDAARDYQAGRILFDDGDYAGASVKFQRAYEHSHDPRLHWNVATCEKNLRHYAAVLAWLERYIREAGATMTVAHRAEVDQVIETVRTLISTVRTTVDQADVSIYVDGALVGTSPLTEPIRVDLGRREFRFSKPDFKDERIVREFAGGSEVLLNVVMKPVEKTGRLTVNASAGDAIRIDGQLVGQTQWTGMLMAGDHEIRVTAEEMLEYRKDVHIVAGDARTLYVTLQPKESSIPTWVWVGAGAVVAGGLATGGYFLFRPPQQVGPESGTLGEVPLRL